jgi:lambda family phage tail tape measure protein
MSLGQLVVELSLDGSEFTLNLKRADGQLAQFIQRSGAADQAIRRAERSTRSWGSALRDGVIVLSLIRSAIQNVSDAAFGWQRAIVSVNAEMERSIQLMKNFSMQTDSTKATAEAIADVQGLLDRASTAPFSLNSITDSFVKLRVAGLDPAEKSLNTLIDSVAAFGGTDQNLQRAAVAIQQMAGKGVVSMEELRQQLGESVPVAINAMADALGTTYSDLVKQISLGRVKSEPALAAMMAELERSFKGRAAAMTETWNGAVAQFETTTKRLALAIGGLNDDGYEEGGYFSTLTGELNSLNDILSDPEMIDSAREFGRALAELVKIAAEGVKWIVEHREALYEWGKAFLYVYGAVKGYSVIKGVTDAMAGSISSLAGKVALAQQAGMGLSAMLATTGRSMVNFTNPTTQAAQSIAGAATQSTLLRGGLGLLGGALGVITGPIGMVTMAAVAGGLAWKEYQDEVRKTRDEVLSLNGALTNNAQLQTLLDHKKSLQEKLEERFGRGNYTIGMQGDFANVREYRAAKAKAEAEIRKVDEDISKGRQELAQIYGEREARAAILAEEKKVAELTRQYQINKKKLADQRERGEITQEQYVDGLGQLGRLGVQDQIDQYTEALSKVEAQRASLEQTIKLAGDSASQGLRERLASATKQADEYTLKLNEARDSLNSIQKTNLQDTIVGGGAGAAGGAAKFNPLVKFMSSLSLSVAKAGATAEEANPHLAQLEQVLQNMAEMGQSADPAMIEKARQFAAQRWEQEKATKAVKEATDSYQASLDRVNQIEKVLTGKQLKNENENQWLKASADAERYREEIVGIQEELARAQATANAQGETELSAKIDEARAVIEDLDEKIDRVAISGATKALNARTKEIEDSMKTQSQLIDQEFEYQMQQAREYYAELASAQDVSEADWNAYYSYISALRAKHERDTESGLQKWIRENQDASEQYKSLWGSAMDSFSDTVADGLIEGKFQIADFVQYVLKELIKIQVAKAVAGIATSIAGAWSGAGAASGSMSAGATQAGYTGTDFSNWVAAQPYANGGIMTKWGNAKLKEYANGGIARSPQVAVFGEGSMAEAYVPLPDGRTIPVTLQGQMAGGGGQQPAQQPRVSVNVINQSGTQMNGEQTGQSFDGEQFVVDVVLKAVNRPGALRDAVKGAA